MSQELEHKISEKTIKLAKEHTEESAKHFETIKEIGEPTDQTGKAIEKHQKSMKHHIENSKKLIDELEKTKSTKIYNKIVSERTAAIQEHIEVTKEFLKNSHKQTEQ